MGIEEELHDIAEMNEQIIRNLTREGLMYHHLEIEREMWKMDFKSKWGGNRKYLPQDFTFEVGDRIIVENVSVGVGSTGLGYNSSDYDYNL